MLSILGYRDIDDAIAIANDTEYGLAGNVAGADLAQARAAARRVRVGWGVDQRRVRLRLPVRRLQAERQRTRVGTNGFDEYLETKGILGYEADPATA